MRFIAQLIIDLVAVAIGAIIGFGLYLLYLQVFGM